MHDQINHLYLKAGSALTAVAVMDWLTAAGKVCAALYAIAVFGEWVWKRLVKPRLKKGAK